MVHVPYRGNALALSELLGGEVQVAFASMRSAIQYIRAGQLRPSSWSPRRVPTCCRTSRPWLSSYRVMMRADRTASAHRRRRPSRLSAQADCSLSEMQAGMAICLMNYTKSSTSMERDQLVSSTNQHPCSRVMLFLHIVIDRRANPAEAASCLPLRCQRVPGVVAPRSA
jgi:hypothetical protein